MYVQYMNLNANEGIFWSVLPCKVSFKNNKTEQDSSFGYGTNWFLYGDRTVTYNSFQFYP